MCILFQNMLYARQAQTMREAEAQADGEMVFDSCPLVVHDFLFWWFAYYRVYWLYRLHYQRKINGKSLLLLLKIIRTTNTTLYYY